MACDLVGINNREPRGENHRGMPCRSGGTRWARRCLLAVPNVHVGDSWTALDQVGAKGTPRPVTCDLARKIGCARSAFVQTALAVLLRQPCRPVGQMLYQDSCISFTEQDFVDSPNPCRGITLDVSACRAAC